MPVATIAATFEANSSRAPSAWSGSPASSVSPTTVRGGTSEMAIATPGSVSETSARTRAKAPTRPVASAPTRSMRSGLTREATSEFVAATTGSGTSSPSRKPTATTSAAPASTVVTPRTIRARSARTTARAVPRMGVISGATIMAPITVASESATIPEPAMIAASVSSTQKADCLRLPSRKSRSVIRSRSAPVTLGGSGAPASARHAWSAWSSTGPAWRRRARGCLPRGG